MINPGQLKSFPNSDELAQLERRLEFHPSTVTDPKVLTQAQVAAYNREGYIKPIAIFGQQEITAVRGFFDDILERTLKSGRNSYAIVSAHMKYGAVYDLLTDPRMVAVVKDILGEDVIGWGAQFFCKMPGDNKIISWHQDASFWPLSPSKTVTAWLAIDDADIENACMRFVAGSHHMGHLTYRFSEDAEQSVLNQTVDQRRAIWPGDLRRIEGRPDFAAQRFAAAWVGQEQLHTPPLWPDVALLQRRCEQRPALQLAQGRRFAQRQRPGTALVEPISACAGLRGWAPLHPRCKLIRRQLDELVAYLRYTVYQRGLV